MIIWKNYSKNTKIDAPLAIQWNESDSVNCWIHGKGIKLNNNFSKCVFILLCIIWMLLNILIRFALWGFRMWTMSYGVEFVLSYIEPMMFDTSIIRFENFHNLFKHKLTQNGNTSKMSPRTEVVLFSEMKLTGKQQIMINVLL